MLLFDDEKQVKDPVEDDVPTDLSDHDQRDEELASDKDWDQASNDAAAQAAQHLADFQSEDVPLSDEDWEEEEKKDDTIPDHIDAAVDASLEDMVDQELGREDGEATT